MKIILLLMVYMKSNLAAYRMAPSLLSLSQTDAGYNVRPQLHQLYWHHGGVQQPAAWTRIQFLVWLLLIKQLEWIACMLDIDVTVLQLATVLLWFHC